VAAPAPPGGVVPYQYIAKGYTELLGRAPSPAEWSEAVGYFRSAGCSPVSLRRFGDALVASPEYRRDYPLTPAAADVGAVVLTLYRFILNREPDATGFVANRDAIAAGRIQPLGAANLLYATTEFTHWTAPAICDPSNPGYYFGLAGDWTAFPAIPTPEHGAPGPDLPESVLQAALNAKSAAGGGAVALPPRQVVGLTTTLVIPGNVTLTTAGSPGPRRYADMAELAKLPGYTELPGYSGMELVRLEPGAHLVHLWVDGQRGGPDPNNFLIFDVRMLGGVGTTVSDDRIGNTYGASSLESDSAGSNVPGAVACSHNVISDNLVEAYSSAHVAPPGRSPDDHPQADGLGIYCPDTEVTGNDIVDISDTAIVLFDGASFLPVAQPQLSDVSDNTIVSAGNSYSFGIATDPSYSLSSGPIPGGDAVGVLTRSFADGTGVARIHDNVLWSGDRTHFDVLLSSGSHDLFGSTVNQNCGIPDADDQDTCGGGRNASGPEWTGNSSDGLLTEIEMGIYVGGTTGAVFADNSFPHEVEVTGGSCPKFPVVVAGDFAPMLHIDVPVHVDDSLQSDSCVNPRF